MLRKPVDYTRITLHLSQVVDLQTQGSYAQAAEELERAIEYGLGNPAATFDLGFLYAQAGRLESAIRQLQHIVKHVDYSLAAHLLLGDLYYRKGQLKQASLEYLEALRLADAQMVPPEHADNLRQLYEPYIEAHRQQDEPGAQEQLCGTVKDLLMRPDWRVQMGRAREQLPSRGDGAPPMPVIEILKGTIGIQVSQVIESLTSIYELVDQGKLRSAMEDAFYTLQHAPTYLPLHTLMGELLIKQGDLKGAVAKFQTVAKVHSTRGEAFQAINLYRKVADLSPMDLGSRGRLIDQLVASGQTEEAIKEYIHLAGIYYNMADFNMARKTYTEALRMAQQSQTDRATRVQILHRMADIDLQSLDWRQALRIFEQIRTLSPMMSRPARTWWN
jgi:tetratricopeptide (TPR) repeat protein